MKLKVKSILSLILVAGLAFSFGEAAKSNTSATKATDKSALEKNAISLNEKENCEKDTANCPKMADCPKEKQCPKDHNCEKSGHDKKDCKRKMHSKKDAAHSHTKEDASPAAAPTPK